MINFRMWAICGALGVATLGLSACETTATQMYADGQETQKNPDEREKQKRTTDEQIAKRRMNEKNYVARAPSKPEKKYPAESR